MWNIFLTTVFQITFWNNAVLIRYFNKMTTSHNATVSSVNLHVKCSSQTE